MHISQIDAYKSTIKVNYSKITSYINLLTASPKSNFQLKHACSQSQKSYLPSSSYLHHTYHTIPLLKHQSIHPSPTIIPPTLKYIHLFITNNSPNTYLVSLSKLHYNLPPLVVPPEPPPFYTLSVFKHLIKQLLEEHINFSQHDPIFIESPNLHVIHPQVNNRDIEEIHPFSTYILNYAATSIVNKNANNKETYGKLLYYLKINKIMNEFQLQSFDKMNDSLYCISIFIFFGANVTYMWFVKLNTSKYNNKITDHNTAHISPATVDLIHPKVKNKHAVITTSPLSVPIDIILLSSIVAFPLSIIFTLNTSYPYIFSLSSTIIQLGIHRLYSVFCINHLAQCTYFLHAISLDSICLDPSTANSSSSSCLLHSNIFLAISIAIVSTHTNRNTQNKDTCGDKATNNTVDIMFYITNTNYLNHYTLSILSLNNATSKPVTPTLLTFIFFHISYIIFFFYACANNYTHTDIYVHNNEKLIFSPSAQLVFIARSTCILTPSNNNSSNRPDPSYSTTSITHNVNAPATDTGFNVPIGIKKNRPGTHLRTARMACHNSSNNTKNSLSSPHDNVEVHSNINPPSPNQTIDNNYPHTSGKTTTCEPSSYNSNDDKDHSNTALTYDIYNESTRRIIMNNTVNFQIIQTLLDHITLTKNDEHEEKYNILKLKYLSLSSSYDTIEEDYHILQSEYDILHSSYIERISNDIDMDINSDNIQYTNKDSNTFTINDTDTSDGSSDDKIGESSCATLDCNYTHQIQKNFQSTDIDLTNFTLVFRYVDSLNHITIAKLKALSSF